MMSIKPRNRVTYFDASVLSTSKMSTDGRPRVRITHTFASSSEDVFGLIRVVPCEGMDLAIYWKSATPMATHAVPVRLGTLHGIVKLLFEFQSMK